MKKGLGSDCGSEDLFRRALRLCPSGARLPLFFAGKTCYQYPQERAPKRRVFKEVGIPYGGAFNKHGLGARHSRSGS